MVNEKRQKETRKGTGCFELYIWISARKL